jgi:hypothetical protein
MTVENNKGTLLLSGIMAITILSIDFYYLIFLV